MVPDNIKNTNFPLDQLPRIIPFSTRQNDIILMDFKFYQGQGETFLTELDDFVLINLTVAAQRLRPVRVILKFIVIWQLSTLKLINGRKKSKCHFKYLQ